MCKLINFIIQAEDIEGIESRYEGYFKLPLPLCSQGLELIRASHLGDVTTVTLLLQDGVDVNFMDEVYTYFYIHVYTCVYKIHM